MGRVAAEAVVSAPLEFFLTADELARDVERPSPLVEGDIAAVV